MLDSLKDTIQQVPLQAITGITGLAATNVITNSVNPSQINGWWQLFCNIVIGGLTLWHLFKKYNNKITSNNANSN